MVMRLRKDSQRQVAAIVFRPPLWSGRFVCWARAFRNQEVGMLGWIRRNTGLVVATVLLVSIIVVFRSYAHDAPSVTRSNFIGAVFVGFFSVWGGVERLKQASLRSQVSTTVI